MCEILYQIASPMFLLQKSVFSFGTAFVSASATFFAVSQYINLMILRSINWRVWWIRTSICLLRGLYASSSASWIVLVLSTNMHVAFLTVHNSFPSWRSQITSFAHDDSAIYSASVLDNAMMSCRWLYQLIAQFAIFITKPLYERLLSTSEAKSESEYAIIDAFPLLLKCSAYSDVFCKYLKIRFTAVQHKYNSFVN